LGALIGIPLAGGFTALPQGRPIDWPSYNGDAQRTGWEKVDSRITKDSVKEFQLVLKRKLEGSQAGANALTPPVVIGLLISYRGFKELAFVTNGANDVWALDADLDRIFWKKHYEGVSAKASRPCAGGPTTLALIPPVNFGARRPMGGPRPGGPPGPGGAPPGAPPARPAAGGILGPGGFGAPRPAFGLSSDGKLHLMNTSTGDEVAPAMQFIPANTAASSLTVVDNTVYTTTSPDCGADSGGVWAIDLSTASAKTASFPLKGGPVSRQGGLAMGADGTVYVQTGRGPMDQDAGKWSNTLLALSPKELKLKQYFTVPGAPETASPSHLNVTAPVVFGYKGRDLIVTTGADGSLYLLDSKSVGGEDHKTPLYRTPPVASSAGGIWGGLSSWLDGETRWVLAPVWGAVNPELNVAGSNGPAANGSIVAFKVEEKDGKTVLTPAWASRNMHTPEMPVITSGVVFALSAGDSSNHATLYALDGTSGKELYSTGNQVTSPANLTGVTLANGRVFFSTTDSTLWGFGVYMER
jgi:hypothetical protein